MRLVERRSASSAFGLDPFRAKAGGDAFLGAISAIFVVGINRVCAYSFDPNAGEFFLIFNAFLEPYAFIECLERVVFDERDTSNLDIIDLRTELDPFVFLSAHDRSQVGSVNADDATSDFLFIHKVELLTSYFFQRIKPLALFGGQTYEWRKLAAKCVPLPDELAQQLQHTTA